MVTRRNNVFGCAANFLRGKKCVLCNSFKTNKTARGYVKCRSCKKQKSLKMIRREIGIITGFYQQVPAYRLANDLGIDYQTVTRVFQNLRLLLYHTAELEGSQLSGEVEMDEAYFGGKRKGKRGRGAAGKSIVFGLLERDGRVYTRVVEGVSAETLMDIIKKKTRKAKVILRLLFRHFQKLQFPQTLGETSHR